MRSKQEIIEWLRRAIANEIHVDPVTIAASAKFTELGADSVSLIALTGDLEEWLGQTVLPSMLWDHPTLDALAEALSRVSAR